MIHRKYDGPESATKQSADPQRENLGVFIIFNTPLAWIEQVLNSYGWNDTRFALLII
jgi:hypothetical protein